MLNALLDLFAHVNDLKALPRTGWLLAGVADVESLADHTCAVAIGSLFLAEAINADPVAQGVAVPLNVGRVVMLALLHDLAESVLTDLPKRSMAVLGPETKHAAEKRILDELLAELPGGERYRRLWAEYEAASTAEARLVKDVDRLEMVFQALRYARRGHRHLSEFWEGHTWHYPLCRDLFQRLISTQRRQEAKTQRF